MTPQPIDTAPKDGGWILACIPNDEATTLYHHPWRVMTWSDQGWEDAEGDPYAPTLWVALPDPQPANTGWRQAVGRIMVSEITGEGWKINGKPAKVPWRWEVWIERPDGSYDDYRESIHYATRDQAERRALGWQEKYGLPIAVAPLDRKVIQFRPRAVLQ